MLKTIAFLRNAIRAMNLDGSATKISCLDK